ncbi:helix-turn-helix domain-containing protein [bacterium]|nr:helix-turn-helix domain-containing protein [Bacteroidota bacterium]MBL7190565.1 helix-turn-helix domain-containing protein [bacterium]
MEKMLKPIQVCEILELSLPTVRRLYRNGELEYRRLGHRIIRIYEWSVEQYVNKHKPPKLKNI